MALPLLKLNLVTPPSLWRRSHRPLALGALALGIICLGSVLTLTWRARHQAETAGRQAVRFGAQTREMAGREVQLIADLKEIDVEQEAPRWKLAERILSERSLPWTRITSELERCLTEDVRIKSILRSKGGDRKVEIKIKGEARTREAEVAFMESLQKNPFFAQVVLEREAERQGGGIDFDYSLSPADDPPAYTPLPKTPPTRKSASRQAEQPKPELARKVTPRQPEQAKTEPAHRGAVRQPMSNATRQGGPGEAEQAGSRPGPRTAPDQAGHPESEAGRPPFRRRP
nr:PilN domain-containing protein [uncultured Holophaga sp.]